jgi:hypothetical protein
VDISLERVQLLGVAAADGVDAPRDDARGFDDSIAVVTDCFDQVGMAHRIGIARGDIDEDVELCQLDGTFISCSSSRSRSAPAFFSEQGIGV